MIISLLSEFNYAKGGHNATTRRYPTVLIQNLRHRSGLVGWWVRSESSKRFLRVCAVGFGDWFWARRKPNPTESKGIFMARPNLNRNIIKHKIFDVSTEN